MSATTTTHHTPRQRPPRPATSRRAGLLALLLVALAAVAIASLAIGSKAIPLDHVWSALLTPTGSEDDTVVRSLRLPRTVLGIAVGFALGIAGAVIQGHTRNPLADPGLLGVSGGAAFFVVLGVTISGLTSLYGYVWFAFAGAFAASVLVFLLGSLRRGGPTPVTMALAGLVVSDLLIALTSAIVLRGGDATLDTYRFWSVGSLANRDPLLGLQVLPFLAVGVLLAALNTPALNNLALGEDVARGLGQHIRLARITGLAAVAVLTGAAVSVCGPINFLGLAVPHLMRPVTGPDYRWLLPASGLAGAVLLLVADIAGRVVARPSELPVGIVLGLLGAPFFVYLVRRSRAVRL
jgi:iron complex transport system permease protein